MSDRDSLEALITMFFDKDVKWSGTMADYLILHGVTIKKRGVCVECGQPTKSGAILCPLHSEDQ